MKRVNWTAVFIVLIFAYFTGIITGVIPRTLAVETLRALRDVIIDFRDFIVSVFK